MYTSLQKLILSLLDVSMYTGFLQQVILWYCDVHTIRQNSKTVVLTVTFSITWSSTQNSLYHSISQLKQCWCDC